MSKVGQPDDALELTAGRATLLRQLYTGVADRDGMAMAANWMRDIWAHYDLTGRSAHHWPYAHLMNGTATDIRTQKTAAEWIAHQCNVEITTGQGVRIVTKKTPEANDTQVAGDHYRKRKIQHWDFAGTNQHSYFGGQISKYLCRHKDKNGAEDVDKAVHFLEKAIEVQMAEMPPVPLDEFLEAQDIGFFERAIITAVHAYETDGNVEFLKVALVLAKELQIHVRTVPHHQV